MNSPFYKLCTARALAAVADDLQDSLLQVGHYGIRPEMCVPVEVGGDALAAGKMQPHHPIAQRLQAVLAAQHIKERPADADVLIQNC